MEQKDRGKKVIRGEGFVRIDLEEYSIMGCYISPNIPIREYKNKVDKIIENIEPSKEMLILGDLNAKSTMSESPIADEKGLYWEEWIESKDLTVHNSGETPTFVRGASRSYIDVTLSTNKIARKIRNWRVSEEESFSLHGFISFEVKIGKDINNNQEWLEKKINKEKLVEEIENNSACFENLGYRRTIKELKNLQDHCLIANTRSRRNQPYWWNEDIELARRRCNDARRTLVRARGRRNRVEVEIEELDETFKNTKKAYKTKINISKKEQWKILCDELENDI